MIQIASQPYKKTYNFAILSDAMLLKVVLYLLVVILAFFAVYSFPSKFKYI